MLDAVEAVHIPAATSAWKRCGSIVSFRSEGSGMCLKTLTSSYHE